MENYKIVEGGGVIRLSDNAYIPPDDGNIDWKAYQDWLAAGGVAVPSIGTRDEVIAKQWSKIKSIRDQRTVSCGFKVGNYWFHSDLLSRGQYQALMLLGTNIPEGLMWKTMSGDFVEMTPALAQQVFAAAVQSDVAIFKVGQLKLAELNGSATPEDVDVTLGWPLGYGEQSE